MELRFTPGATTVIAFTTAIVLTTVLGLWITVGVAVGNIHANMISNLVEMATVVSWPTWAVLRQRDTTHRGRQEATVDDTVRQLRSH
ncbi:MAG TPA: hypothetical protein VEO01_22915 [Pseudonocardiaceae bacterium]|nr:hypothetical protein [Pseudonocardiaceae bacterium]